MCFRSKAKKASRPWNRWISWARRCRIPVFVELARRIVRHRQAIDAALGHGLSQGLIESTNTKIRLLTHTAFGFRSPEALIALAMLAPGGHRPALPGRTKHPRISQYRILLAITPDEVGPPQR
jgi:transposase